MEEADLLKERLQAITDKRGVQEDIRVKKQELEQEKLKLQYLKKTSLREQWLLEDLSSHNALQQQKVATDQQKTRTLQNNIYRIEKEVEFLEREESRISTNESFILKTLRSVERSPRDIIKEAQENFVPEPIQSRTTSPGLPESFTPTSRPSDPPRHNLLALEINVCSNRLTGESQVVSTATVTPQDLQKHSGVKVHDDGRKCVYAPQPQQESHDLSCREVEQLLRAALGNHQEEYRYRNQPEGRCHENQQPITNHVGGDHPHGNHLQMNPQARQGEMHLHGNQDSYSHHRERNGSSNMEKGHGPGHRHANRPDAPSVYRDYNGNHGNPTRAKPAVGTNGGPVPRSHDQEAVSPWRPELCYTPANHIPLRDYVTVDEEELYLYSPPSFHLDSQSEVSPNGDSQSTAFFYGPAQSKRAPSPLYEVDAPFTILSAMETSELITAVFLGFQTTQDESGCGQEDEGSLEAELVIINDANGANGASGVVEEKVGYTSAVAANHALGQEDKGRTTGSGSRKVRKQYKACCTVC
ncbi:unnamed protein product [Lota lota]